MDEGLKIRVGADLRDVTKSLSDLKSDFRSLSKEIEGTTDGKQLLSLNKRLEETARTMQAIKAAGKVGFDDFGQKITSATSSLKNIPSSANGATLALTDLGRIAQDAPFGFIAIQNNLNPLIESFGRLKAQTGSTGGAIKALLGSLTGAGGLGVALSLLSSGLLFAQMGMSAWTRGFGKTKAEAKSLSDTIKELIKPIGDIGLAAEGSAQGEIARVGALVRVIRDQNAARATQVRALEELKRINKSYFGDLKLEETSLAKLTQLQNDYTKAIVANAILKNLESEIGKVGAELYKQNKAISDNEKKQIDLRRQIEATNKAQIEADSKAGARTFFLNDQSRAITDISVALSKQRKEISPLEEQFNALKNSIQEITLTTLNFKGLTEAKEKIKKESKFKLIGPEIEIPVSFGGKQIFSESVKEMYDAFKNFKTYFEKNDDLKIEVPLTIDPIGGNFDKFFTEDMRTSIKQSDEQLKAFEKQLGDIGRFVGGPLSDTFANLFRTIATDGKLSMKQVGQAAQQLVVDLIAAAIKAAVLAVILKAFGNKGGAIGSFGSLFQSLLTGSKVTNMATGGIVPAGFENDTFPARLSSREAVIPLDRLDNMIGGRGDSGPMVARLQGAGPDLILYLERQRRSQSRSFG
ncbi:hypothetical protein [Agriterribacter sp.]|uniref:hypothetical protein n=1 Tax=Agriterribacter sp. TaxID=2821509 RepID=UPI002D161EA5|nr:hypothetical protein [Agriterribacter sp.]HTN08858.1 hypothetical protein [Agriterribacter sp.]